MTETLRESPRREPLRYSLPEAQRLLGISRATLYRRIAEGHITAVRDGGRRFITADELAWYAGRSH